MARKRIRVWGMGGADRLKVIRKGHEINGLRKKC